MNTFFKFATIENISFFLGLIGTTGTAWQVIQSRRKIKTNLHYFGYNSENGLALAYIQFDNLSNSAISVTDVSLLIGNNYYPCQKLPISVSSTYRQIGKKEFSYSDIYNIQLPVCLSGFGGSSGYFLFQIPKESVLPVSTHRKFLISTSRGSSFQVELKPVREYLP